MFGKGKRKILDGVPQRRPFKDARAARPSRQRKLDAVERSTFARGGARQRGKRMRLVVERRRRLLLRDRLLPFGEGLLFVCRRLLLLGNCPLFVCRRFLFLSESLLLVCLRRLGFCNRLLPVGFRGLVLSDCPLLVSVPSL